MKPLISIIVPVYNTAKYLEETIQSVINQTVENWELILIDDGSTDESAAICQQFVAQDRRIRYFYKTNSGQAAARNVGLRESAGDWIAFLDADDLWLPEKLASQLGEIALYKPDFLYGLGYYYYPERAEKLEPYNWITGERSGLDFFKILYHSCAVNTNTVLFRRELVQEVGFFNENETMRGTEDWDYWMRIAKHVQRIYGAPTRLVYYRIHPGGIHLQHIRMLKGKALIYSQYDADATIQRLQKLKQYRYVYRELLNYLWVEERGNELKAEFAVFAKKDRFGLGTVNQRLLIRILGLNAFMWFSQKVIYRIAYRLENLSYFLFLKK